MNELEMFNNDNFGEVRALKKDDEVWFVAKDVADILEYSRTHDATRRLDDDEKGKELIRTPGGNQEMTVVNEFGLYNLVLGSQKKEAKEFKRWITHEVIPAIRKTGSYSVDEYNNDINEFDMLRSVIDKLEEADKKADEALDKSNKLEHRVDNLDNIEIDGDLKDRLNSMVKKYAHDNGISYGVAYGKFYQTYNKTYNTNVKLRVTNYEKKTDEDITVPKLLAKDGELEDAVRVLDKMLN